MKANSKRAKAFVDWLSTLSKGDNWCILVVADPDALGSAMALKRILTYKSQHVTIASVNTVTRPDNLAMLRYLRIPLVSWKEDMRDDFDHYAIVDGQPHHNPAFKDIKFSFIMDHHPVSKEHVYQEGFVDIQDKFGATCTMFTDYLRFLNIRPGKLLATALLYGIRSDTGTFERSGGEQDFRAYQWLSRIADSNILRRILRSEYMRQWLPLFSHAFQSLRSCKTGAHAHVGKVQSPDMLVAIADFFTRVHGLRWVAVSGIFETTLVVIFRSDGSKNVGELASKSFGEDGSAGGHKAMARAEIPVEALGENTKYADYVFLKLAKSWCKGYDRQ